MNDHRPKIGLALSGGSLRSIAHIGVLEVFSEHKIPIDYISACSSASIVAASFSCGTMDQLKQDWLDLKLEKRGEMIERTGSNGGLYHLHKAEIMFCKYTRNQHFE